MGSMQEWATRLLLPAGVSASALPMLAARALRAMFLLYGGVGLLIWWLYRRPLATAVPRSLAAALSPTLSGALFAAGWILSSPGEGFDFRKSANNVDGLEACPQNRREFTEGLCKEE